MFQAINVSGVSFDVQNGGRAEISRPMKKQFKVTKTNSMTMSIHLRLD